jgi:hypothetical protein
MIDVNKLREARVVVEPRTLELNTSMNVQILIATMIVINAQAIGKKAILAMPVSISHWPCN